MLEKLSLTLTMRPVPVDWFPYLGLASKGDPEIATSLKHDGEDTRPGESAARSRGQPALLTSGARSAPSGLRRASPWLVLLRISLRASLEQGA